jgi:hypothetical protein
VTLFGFRVHYGTWELRIMRLLLAWLVVDSLRRPAVAAAPHPHGLAQLVDLTFLADPRIFATLEWVLLVPLALFVWGRWMAVSLTYVLALFVGTFTLRNSQGAIGHSTQIVGLVLLAMWLAYTVGSLARLAGARSRRPDLTLHDLSIYWVHQFIAGAYMVAGVSKLTRSGIHLSPLLPAWMLDVQYAGVQITKTNEELYYATLDPTFLEQAATLGGFFVAHPDLTRVLFSGGLVLELLAFLLLIDRRWAAVIGVLLILMHTMISHTMNLSFRLNVYVVLIFLVNVPYWAAALAARRSRTRVSSIPSLAARPS